MTSRADSPGWRRRELLKAAGYGAVLATLPGAASVGCGRDREPGGPPNLLYIMVDELRWDVLGCAGHPTVQTPHIDRLARAGVQFNSTYTVAPICMPARRSAFTGRYAHVHGVVDNQSPANDGEILVTSLLKHHGYDTAISGKLHYLPADLEYDFDDFWSYNYEGPGTREAYPGFLKRKYGTAELHPSVPGSCPYPDDLLGREIGRLAYPREHSMSHWITDRALEYLHSRSPGGQPWFLFVSYKAPHSPYRPPEPYFSMYPSDSFDVPEIPREVAALRRANPDDRWRQRHTLGDEGLLRALTGQYFGHVTHVDDNVGRLLATLDELELSENTIVVFTSDHGNMLGDRGLFFKGTFYDGATRIPQIVRVPPGSPYAGQFRGGRVVDALVENIDLMPTLLELCGLPVPERGIQGQSLVPLVGGAAPTREERVFSERLGQLLLTPDYRLHFDPRGVRETELYDRKQDPDAARNVAEDPEYAPVLAELRQRLGAWQADRPPPVSVPGLELPAYAVLDPATRAKLRSLEKPLAP